MRAVEMAQRGQSGRKSIGTIAIKPEVPCTNISSSIPEHFPYFPAPQNLPYFSSSHGFPPMTSLAHLSFQQLNIPMQSIQPSHPMLHFSSPFQVFKIFYTKACKGAKKCLISMGQEHLRTSLAVE
jgi:hypothetical protein